MRSDYSQRVICESDRLRIVQLSFKSAFDAPQRLVLIPPFFSAGLFLPASMPALCADAPKEDLS